MPSSTFTSVALPALTSSPPSAARMQLLASQRWSVQRALLLAVTCVAGYDFGNDFALAAEEDDQPIRIAPAGKRKVIRQVRPRSTPLDRTTVTTPPCDGERSSTCPYRSTADDMDAMWADLSEAWLPNHQLHDNSVVQLTDSDDSDALMDAPPALRTRAGHDQSTGSVEQQIGLEEQQTVSSPSRPPPVKESDRKWRRQMLRFTAVCTSAIAQLRVGAVMI